jgi:flagellar hook-associated protein 2
MATTSTAIGTTQISQLISQLMVLERQPIERLQTQKDQLDVRRGVYVDTQSRLSLLKNLADDLMAGGTVWGQKTATASDASVLSASAGAGAASLSYSISNVALAKTHLVASDPLGDAATPRGESGTIVLGGADARSVANAVVVDTTVTAFAAGGSLRAGQREFSDGAYHIEVRDNSGVKEFRVVDSQGQAVSVDDASDAGTGMTAEWQSLTLVANNTFDTARGLTVTFGAGATSGTKGNGAAKVDYAAQGAQISISAGQSLSDIAAVINGAAYAQDQGVAAGVIQTAAGVYKLTLQAEVSGLVHPIQARDASGAVLQGLGILNAPATGGFKNEVQAAANATFSINGLTVSRSRNTGLTDVVGGVTLNLLKDSAGPLTLAVAPDSAAIKGKAQGMLNQFNEVLSYLKSKMAVDTNTYARGPLAGDSMLFGLRADLVSDLTAQVSGLASGVPSSLAAIGITMNTTTMQMQISDSAALDKALSEDAAGVGELFSAVMTRVSSTLTPLVSSSGITQSTIGAIDSQKTSISQRITSLEELMPRKEATYRGQYGAMLQQINEMGMLQASLESLNALNLVA